MRYQQSVSTVMEGTPLSRSPRMGGWGKEGADRRTLRDGGKERCGIGEKSKCGRRQGGFQGNNVSRDLAIKESKGRDGGRGRRKV